jgi:AAA domain
LRDRLPTSSQNSSRLYTKVTPSLPDGARKILLGLVDIVIYADLEPERQGEATTYRRVLRTKPAKHYEAGDRTGRLPETLPLDYAAFAIALATGKSEPILAQKPTQSTKPAQNGK